MGKTGIRNLRALLLSGALALGPAIACAAQPVSRLERTSPWVYGQVEYTQSQLKSDETGSGFLAQVGLTVSKRGYLVASGSRINAYSGTSGAAQEDIQTYAGGLGLHDDFGSLHPYAWAGYIDWRRRVRAGATASLENHEAGAVATLGVRWLAAPWLSIEPEVAGTSYGIAVRARAGLRVFPHGWLLASYNRGDVYGDYSGFTIGLRLQGKDEYAPRKP